MISNEARASLAVAWGAVPRAALIAFGIWAGLVLTHAALVERFDPPRETQITCLVRATTGVPCPTCGCTRLVVAAGQGRFAAAFAANPLVFMGLMATAVAGSLRLTGWGARITVPRRRRAAAWATLGVLVLVNWAYLIARDAPHVFGGPP